MVEKITSLEGLYDERISDYQEKRFKWFRCSHPYNQMFFWTDYELIESDFYKREIRIGTCNKCKKRLIVKDVGICSPSEEAQKLIDKVLEEHGAAPRSSNSYGSRWWIEIPVEISLVLKNHGEETARRIIRQRLYPNMRFSNVVPSSSYSVQNCSPSSILSLHPRDSEPYQH